MKRSKLRAASATMPAILAFMLFLTQACKKSSGSDDNNNPSSEFYLSATVNNKDWTANMLSNRSEPVAAGETQGLILIVGGLVVNKDTSAIVIAFPDKITINQQFNFSIPGKSLAAYATRTETYSTTYSTGSGSFTVSSFDQTTRVIEGNFSCTAFTEDGSHKLTISNGKFRAKVEAEAPKPPSGVKM